MAEAAESAIQEGGNRVAKDLFSGAVGGVAQVLIGQPFDIVKVRLQTSTTTQTSALQCAKQILQTEGASAFYKGTLTPLLGIGACVSVQFGAFHYFKRLLTTSSSNNTNTNTNITTTEPKPPLPSIFLAGSLAGLANTPLSTPIEHIRIRLQTQPHTASQRLYTGPLDCIRQLTRQAGFRHGLYRGFSATALREASAYGAWFSTFEYLMTSEASRSATGRRGDIPAWKIAVYGGLSGEALWLVSYPFDVVKSRMQSDAVGRGAVVGQRYAGLRDCFVGVWREGGVRGFWRGIGPTLLRAMPVSAGTFAVVEFVVRALG